MSLPGLQEIKDHLPIGTGSAQDGLLQNRLLPAAQMFIETHCGVRLEKTEGLSETHRIGSGGRESIAPDYQPIDPESVAVVNENGEEIEAKVVGGRIFRADGYLWAPGHYALSYGAGFEETPADLNLALLKLIARFFAVRDDAQSVSVDGFSRAWREMRDGELRPLLCNYPEGAEE